MPADWERCNHRRKKYGAAGVHRSGKCGYFSAPTIAADLPLTAEPVATEPFGPLALCVAVDSLEKGIVLANGLPVGVSARAFTSSLQDEERLQRELECGASPLTVRHTGRGCALR